MTFRYTALTLCLLYTLAAFNTAHAQLPEDVTAAATERLEGKSGSGMIIGVINSGGTTYYNFNGSDSGEDVITPSTIVEIGSVSKVFTALIAARLMEEGTLKLQDDIASYLPENTTVPERGGRTIKVLDLLNHTSALPRLPVNLQPTNPANPYEGYTAEDAFKFMKFYAPTREPGAEYEYSNFGIALMGLALEHSTGKPYADLVKQYITGPLEMKSTWLEVPPAMQDMVATPYLENNEVAYWDMGIFAPAGGIKSTPEDMVRFVQAALGTYDNSLTEANALASADMTKTDIPFTSIGLGWHITKTPKATAVWHNGGTGGFRSFIGFNMAENKGVVVFVNNGVVDPTDIGLHIINPDQPVSRYPEKVVVTNETLKPYVGKYELAPGFIIDVTVKGDRIFAQATGQDRFEIYPESKTKFNYRVTVASIEFNIKDGSVIGLTLNQNQQDMFAKRLK